MIRRAIRAMGTTVEVLLVPDVAVDEAERAVAEALGEIARVEDMASRFRPESELSRLNAAGAIDASVDLLRLVGLAMSLRDVTGGRFDPTVRGAMLAAGYDRTLDDVPVDGPPAGPAVPAGGVVDIDRRSGRITLGEGLTIDLGGIAKGWAADRAADVLGLAGACLVSVGGDIAVRGRLDGEPWPVGIVRSDGPATLGLSAGGMATSGVDRRRWRRGGVEMHHVIDPATGRPSDTDLVRVTAVAEDAAHAEAWATALLLAGATRARAEADERGLPAVLVGADGNTTDAGGLR
jgi:thiamine biosynthesis lipoprotein